MTRCICGNVADVVFDGSLLENADGNIAVCRSQVSSPTALGREAVVNFCRAWLLLIIAAWWRMRIKMRGIVVDASEVGGEERSSSKNNKMGQIQRM